jgi:hypothetical protein
VATPIDQAIRKRGFRRWYERQLYESHAHLVTGLLSLIGMAVTVEMVEFRKTVDGFLTLVAVAAAGGGLCLFTWRQFTRRLALAEYVAARATCKACGAYGRFEIQGSRPAAQSPAGCVLEVRCRACSHEWPIA